MPELAVRAVMTGALAVARGVTERPADALPPPAPLRARTFTTYLAPFWSPVISSELAVLAASTAAQVVPPSTVYW